MKKILIIALLFANIFAKAQSVTLSLVTPSCDSNGVVAATITGYTPPFLVQWYAGSTFRQDSVFGMSDTLHGFVNGTVMVYLYQLSGGFDTSVVYSFGSVVNATVANDTAICPSLGMLTAVVTGGTTPYTYSWTAATSGSVLSTANPATALPAGYYALTVHDHAGCVVQLITQDTTSGSEPQVIINPDFSYTFTGTYAYICPALDTQYIIHSGGTPPFTFSWYTGYAGSSGGTLLGSADTLIYRVTSAYAQDYGQITDALGCTAVQTYDVEATPDFTAVVNTTDANCTNGAAGVDISGGVAPFTFLWSTGATADSITGLVAGEYTVNVMDSLGCNETLYGYVSQGIYITVNTIVTNATCTDSNGSVIAFGSGGTPPYSYVWSNGGTTDAIGSLGPNSYNVAVTDAIGCTGNGYAYVGTSTPITVSYATTPSSCTSPTGTVALTISGGTAPYTVTWYTTPAMSGASLSGLDIGNYTFYIVDAAGCTQTGTITIPPVDVISLSFTTTPALCTTPNGSTVVTAIGGVAPYTYAWTGGSSTTPTLSGVTSGTYYATVTDANHCQVTSCQYIPFNSPLVLGISTTQASCLYTADGTMTALAALGTPPYTYTMGGVSSGAVTVTGLQTGEYWEYVTDAAGCTDWQYFNVGYNVSDSSCFCMLKGNVFFDSLGTCIKVPGDPGINNIQIDCSPFGYTYSDTGGNYYFLLPSGTYNVSENVLGFYPLSPCQVNNIPISVTAASGCVITQNFADTVDPIHDMSINTWDYNAAVPGNTYYQITVVSNNGTNTEPNILASYVPDGQLYAPSFVPSGIFTGAPYYYNTAAGPYSLLAGASTLFMNSFNVPTSIPLGTTVVFNDSVVYQAPMTNWLTDYSPWNNLEHFTTVTVASYDPNFKEVNPAGDGPLGYITYADSILTYMVHFQNTGTFMAQNVVVIDTLDPNLDWTTLRPVYMQNEGKVDMDNNGHVTFTFSNIDLPTATGNPITSNSMFEYTIKTKRGLAIGTQFRNRASIYFDHNPPILTNQTLNTLWFPETVKQVSNNAYNTFEIYPNPASGLCYAQLNSDRAGSAEIRIIDISGNSVLHQTITLQKGLQNVPIDASAYGPGVYFVTIYGMGETKTQKLLILK